MRFPGSIFQQQAYSGANSRGVITEEGDGELILPPVIQAVARVGAPFFSWGAASAAPEFNFATSFNFLQTGAVAAQDVNFGPIRPGHWHLDIDIDFNFSGTTNQNKNAILYFDDTGSSATPRQIFRTPLYSSNVSVHQTKKLEFTFAANWRLRATIDATLALEVANFHVSVIAQRLF